MLTKSIIHVPMLKTKPWWNSKNLKWTILQMRWLILAMVSQRTWGQNSVKTPNQKHNNSSTKSTTTRSTKSQAKIIQVQSRTRNAQPRTRKYTQPRAKKNTASSITNEACVTKSTELNQEQSKIMQVQSRTKHVQPRA